MSDAAGASPLGLVRLRDPHVKVQIERFWAGGAPPAWAIGWGADGRGPWAAFQTAGVIQRLRWIPPGTFRMGSPDDEPGRLHDEGPMHDVTISRGFWLFETPCTQALWEAVMEDNPSRFKSPDRPVEQVSWEDCQVFVKRLGARVPGLEVDLPTEAEWEYACRGGTPAALYTGPIEILGKRNAPALDAIAWYGGNSGLEFDLPEGWDASDWAEKQHAFSKAGTRRVGLKRPNAWGLYDMLGNVYEWCSDAWSVPGDRGDKKDAVASGRVIRGGSWYSDAREVRAAYRCWIHPSFRDGNLGFRCRVQERELGDVESTAGGSPRVAEPRGDRKPLRSARRRSRRSKGK